MATAVQAPACSLENYLAMPDHSLDERIAAVRAELGERVTILGHHYQRDEVIRFADFTGDSYRLSKLAAETKSHYILMGLDKDLNEAMKKAARETVRFLMEDRGLTKTDAYSLASIGVDFKIAEAVDQVQLVVGMIPKKIFKNNPEYWYKE